VVQALIRLVRPRQWTKNTVCLAALIFSGKLSDAGARRHAIIVFLAFCLASSAVYIVNDIRDVDADRAHPVKRHRPLAAGNVDIGAALVWALALAAGSVALSLVLLPRARVELGSFLVLNLLYSMWLKTIPILDVMAIAAGFVLRVQAGVDAIGAPQSAWIVLTMFFMALFLGFTKRRGEMTNLGAETGRGHRLVLASYSIGFVDMLLGLSATTALVCYSLYAVTVQANETFLLTVLPVVFGIARYMMLVLVEDAGGEDPGEILTRDGPLVLAVLAWVVLCVAVIYFDLHLFPARP